MTHVTVVGLGPMGRALAGALLDAGLTVTVWNRTAARADELLGRGARWAATPGEAVAASAVTLINVVDHDVLDGLLEAAGSAVDGRVIVGLTSDTPHRARRASSTRDPVTCSTGTGRCSTHSGVRAGWARTPVGPPAWTWPC
jgi:3-hydroxyisobutyrate dehydrogenase-like beta-hydroxyacid dehydrogenase